MATTLATSLRADTVGGLRLRDACRVAPSTSVDQTVRQMTAGRSGCALLVDEGDRLVGIFTERDFVSRVVARHGDVSAPVEHVATPAPHTVTRQDSVHRAVELMGAGQFRHLPVVDEGRRPVGVLTVKDIMHYLVEYFPAKVYNLPPRPDQTHPEREGA